MGLKSSTNASLHPSRFASCSRGFSVFWTTSASCVRTCSHNHPAFRKIIYETHNDWDAAIFQYRLVGEPVVGRGPFTEFASYLDDGQGSTGKGTLRELCEECLRGYVAVSSRAFTCSGRHMTGAGPSGHGGLQRSAQLQLGVVRGHQGEELRQGPVAAGAGPEVVDHVGQGCREPQVAVVPQLKRPTLRASLQSPWPWPWPWPSLWPWAAPHSELLSESQFESEESLSESLPELSSSSCRVRRTGEPSDAM